MNQNELLCRDCRFQKDGLCTRFNFKADMREQNPWCKSGEQIEVSQ